MSIVPKKMLDEKVRFVIVGSDEVPAYLDPRHREKNPTLRSPLCCHRTPSSPLSPGQKISIHDEDWTDFSPNDVCYLMKVAFNAHPQRLLNVFLLIKGHTSSILGRHLEHCRVPGSGLESPQSCGSVFAPRNEPESRLVCPLD